jgi:hypothetical protein
MHCRNAYVVLVKLHNTHNTCHVQTWQSASEIREQVDFTCIAALLLPVSVSGGVKWRYAHPTASA